MIAAVITTLDNASLLPEQVSVLRRELEPYESAIVVVNNGSIDGTREWLDRQGNLLTIHRQNRGAGPGRNAGMNAAPGADFYFLLDGGILPMVNSIQLMLQHLEARPACDVIAPPLENFAADRSKADRRLASIDPGSICRRWDLSMTAYCLARRRAFEPHRFSEDGPFGEPGWGVDDNEMAARWWRAGVTVEIFGNGRPYRRASGSFKRLFRETGIWPNQYGSVYEKRLVKYTQDYPDHWDNGIEESLILVSRGRWRDVAQRIVDYRSKVETRHHEIIVVADGSPATQEWIYRHSLRQHHGDTTIASDGGVLRRSEMSDYVWCGNFRVTQTLDEAKAAAFPHRMGQSRTLIDEC